jgi:pantoate--beta-alanine ligase
MITARSVGDLRHELRALRTRGAVGFVPTMGALHAGHVRLFEIASHAADVVVASVFVNPTQFNDPKDLAAYPRPEHEDAAMAQAAGVDVLFLPPATEVYPDGFATTVTAGGAAKGFEGTHRPGHFDGVATVCVKLFSMVQCDIAWFGQKDAQQVAVIRQTVRDLNLPLEIRVVPTVRDADGVALSSRNARLSTGERDQARAIPRALEAAIDAHAQGRDPIAAARRVLGSLEVEYLDVADFAGDPTVVVAVRLGATRLIDNVPLNDPARAGLRAAAS